MRQNHLLWKEKHELNYYDKEVFLAFATTKTLLNIKKNHLKKKFNNDISIISENMPSI